MASTQIHKIMKTIRYPKNSSLIILLLILCFTGFKIKAEENICCKNTQGIIKHCENLHKEITNTFDMEEYIVINVEAIDSLVSTNKKNGLYLWIDGVFYPNLKISFIDILCNKLYFQLKRDTSKTSPWNSLFSYSYYFKSPKVLGISIGTKEKVLTNCVSIYLDTTGSWMYWVGYLLILLLLITVCFLYKRLLRDGPPFSDSDHITVLKTIKANNEPLSEKEIYQTDLPFSLSRFQLLFWTILIIISIIYIWIYTDSLITPSTTVLLLLGISGGTHLIGRTIDNDKSKQANVAPADRLTVKQFHEKGYTSKGLFQDMLSDENGLSVHRFQLLLFTIVLGIYFLWQVIYYLAMPDFNETLLLLMGISSTTYTGIKITEK
jgi:hypothetical protein